MATMEENKVHLLRPSVCRCFFNSQKCVVAVIIFQQGLVFSGLIDRLRTHLCIWQPKMVNVKHCSYF